MDEWVEVYVKSDLSDNTYLYYLQSISRINRTPPSFLHSYLKDVSEMEVQKYLNSLEDKYAKSTICGIRTVFNQAFMRAEKNRLCFNPLQALSVPKKASVKIVSELDPDEQNIVKRAAREAVMGHLALFILATGVRACEMMNLKWMDFDRKREIIYIRNSKSKAGVRIIPLTREALNIILDQKAYCDYIFTSTRHTKVTETVLRKLYERLRKVTGIKDITNHIYRHSFATRLVENDADIKAVSAMLGHKSVYFTMDRYVGANICFLRSEIKKIEKTPESRRQKLHLLR